jgi:hypothetical protein
MEKITIRIKKGQQTVETEGFVGTSCKAATEELERRAGVVLKDDFKPEYYDVEVQSLNQS